MSADVLREVAADEDLMEIGRKAIEDALIEFRDSRMFVLRNNGFVVKEPDGEQSSIIRFGPETGVRIALEAIAKHLAAQVAS